MIFRDLTNMSCLWVLAVLGALVLSPNVNVNATNEDVKCANNDLPMMQILYAAQTNVTDPDDIFCTATVLNHYWLLTLSSCMFDGENPSRYRVQTNKQSIVVKNVIKHPSFNNELGSGHDIALINVDNRIVIDDDCLAPVASKFKFDESGCMIAKRDIDSGQLAFTSSEATVLTPDHCPFSDGIKPELVECATSTSIAARKGVCQHEAGAVVLCPTYRSDRSTTKGALKNFVLRAISSWGDLRCETRPYLFTALDSYADWINQHIG